MSFGVSFCAPASLLRFAAMFRVGDGRPSRVAFAVHMRLIRADAYKADRKQADDDQRDDSASFHFGKDRTPGRLFNANSATLESPALAAPYGSANFTASASGFLSV